MGGVCSTHEIHTGFSWETQKRPLGKRRRGRDNIKMDLKEKGWDGMDCIHLAQDRYQLWALVNTAMNLRIPQDVAKFLSSSVTGSFSRRIQLYGVGWYS
jgi:hypothetical protein